MESDQKCNAVVPSGVEVPPSSPTQQPDDDAIKMFVGQIPRTWDENDLRDLFKEFGPIYQINVLRDKVTNQSRGCCFITFYTRKAALDAQNALHNIKTLPAMHHPIQMKPADSENRNERKLFIGMLSKKCNESDVKAMFSTYGAIEECTVLRDSNGQSKGCAFVTFSTRQCAINAIRAMNHSQTMEGCSSPLVVKFADTRKEKDQKRQQQLMANLWNMTTFANLGNAMAQYLPNAQNSPFTGFGNQSGMGAFNIQQLAALAAAQSGTGAPGTGNTTGGLNLPALPAPAATPGNTANSTSTNTNDFNLQSLAALASLANNPGLNPMIVQNLAALAAASANNAGGIAGLAAALRPNNQQPQQPATATAPQQDGGAATTPPPSWQTALAALLARTANSGGPGNAGGGGGMNTLSPGIGGMNNPLGSMNGMGPRMGNGPHSGMEHTYSGIQQFSGPEGANLFIYHLPQEFTDSDLAQTFLPFGNVISAKVFVDKHTNLSKCFGFVSYDNPISAQSAIQHMNGFQIGMKRLKVQLKRSKDASKPY